MMRLLYRCIAGMLVSTLPVGADTIYFRDGSSLDGTVHREKDTSVILALPNGRMTFPMSDIDRIEYNAADGTTNGDDASETPEGKVQDETPALPEMDRHDRRRLRDMLDELLSAGDAARDAAMERIVRLGKTCDIFPFLERALPYLTDRQSVAVLQAVVQIDAERAQPLLETAARSPLPRNRAAAMALLVSENRDDARRTGVIELLVRGVLDSAWEVQLASVQALERTKDRSATPALIHGLRSSDERVRAASVKALRTLWPDANLERPADSPDGWQMLLMRADEDVRTRFDPATLEPLVDGSATVDLDYNLAIED